jgi:chromosome segregation and condensation protein ScpB
MNVTVEIPDDLAPRLTAGGHDLSREALEMIAAEAYKQDRITKPELQRLLGIETSYQLDGFLKAHDIWIEYTLEDAAREQRSLDRLGL